MDKYLYFDYAAATPMDKTVFDAMQPYFTEQFYNPSATYLPAVGVHRAVQTARVKVAHYLGARPSEIIFTAGGTEANNLAIRGIMEQYPGGNVVVSAIEHESVLAPARAFDCREATVTPQGIVDLDKLAASIDDHTVLVSVMYANNEVGTIQPIRKIAQLLDGICKQRRQAGNDQPLYFHTDAAQATPYLDIHAARLGVDLMTINGGKMYGPKGSGALFVSHRVQLSPLLLGGGQELGVRSGTENVPGIVGLSAALELVQTRREQEVERLQQLQNLFFELLEENLPQAIVNGSRKTRLPNNVHITLSGQDNERLLLQLEQENILAAAGSACSASNEEPSHVLRAMGISDADAQSSLRFTMGKNSTHDHIKMVVFAIKNLATL